MPIAVTVAATAALAAGVVVAPSAAIFRSGKRLTGMALVAVAT